MCGIFGLISGKWQSNAESAAQLISHRGPDDYGVYRDGLLCLVHYISL
jgi:asparagine synthetase B (glutamine-hydrolysing)